MPVVTYKQHIIKLCRKYRIRKSYIYHSSNAEASAYERRIRIPRNLTKATNYAISLHEIGHILTAKKGSKRWDWADEHEEVTRYILSDERYAWYKAIQLAMEWTWPMQQMMDDCLKTYIRHHKRYLKRRLKKIKHEKT